MLTATIASQPRKREPDLRTVADFGFEEDLSAVLLDDLAHEREAEARRLLLLHATVARDAVELLPHAILIFQRDAVAAVFHGDAHGVGFERRRERDARAFGAVLDGVVNEVGDGARHEAAVGGDGREFLAVALDEPDALA